MGWLPKGFLQAERNYLNPEYDFPPREFFENDDDYEPSEDDDFVED